MLVFHQPIFVNKSVTTLLAGPIHFVDYPASRFADKAVENAHRKPSLARRRWLYSHKIAGTEFRLCLRVHGNGSPFSARSTFALSKIRNSTGLPSLPCHVEFWIA